VHNASGIVFTPDGSYAFVAARADQVNKVFGGGFNGASLNAGGVSGYLDQSANPLYEAGNVAIIKDPLSDHPQVVAATRPTPYGFPVDLALSADGRYLYVSYQGLPTSAGSGGVMVFDARAMLQQVQLQLSTDPSGRDMRKYAIDDLPLVNGNRAANAQIDLRADYLLHTDTLADGSRVTAFGIPAGSNRPPVLTGGFPGGIAVQTRSYPLSVYDASGDSTPETVFQHGVLKVSFGLPSSGLAGVVKSIQLRAKPTAGGADVLLKTYTGQQLQVNDELLNLDALVAGPADGFYKIYLHIEFENGAAAEDVGFKSMTIQGDRSVSSAPNVASDGMIRGSFAPQTYNLSDYVNDGVVIFGGGGTDTLALGVLPAQLTSIDGRSLSAFSSAASSAPSQAIYRGTAFDYLCLDSGQEIYCQGIERLVFSDGTVKELQVRATDPFFNQQWNLAATDIPDAWRFTTGSSQILIVSIDSGLPATPAAADDLLPSRLITNSQSYVGGVTDNVHGHQSISIMASIPQNARGVAGINWVSQVMIQDVVEQPVVSMDQAIKAGLDFAVANGMKVVFQASVESEAAAAQISAVTALLGGTDSYALYTYAAGNHATDIDNPAGSLGAWARLFGAQSNGLAIGAVISGTATVFSSSPASFFTTSTGGINNATAISRASYSNFGPKLTLVAPTDSPAVRGDGIVPVGNPLANPPQALYFNGTSAATPNVAGIASLVWSAAPQLSGADLRQLLIDTSSPLVASKTITNLVLKAAVPDATTTSISVSDAAYTPNGNTYPPPQRWVITVGSEDMLVSAMTPVVGGSTYTVVRGYNGTTAVAHSNASSVVRSNYDGATANVGSTPGSVRDASFGYGLIDAGTAVRRAFALTSNPVLANFYLNNGTRNLAIADTGTVTVPGVGADVLTMNMLDASGTTAQAAFDLWSSRLQGTASMQIGVSLEDLPDGQLGEARIDAVGADGLPTAGTIVLDRNASGVGWFVDPTPLDNSEFSTTLDSTAFLASGASDAAGKYDLLTVLLHEEGHLLGFNPQTAGFSAQVGTVAGSQVFVGPGFTARLSADGQHLAGSSYPDDLMNDVLAPSVRRLPSAMDVQVIAAVRSDSLAPSHPDAAFPAAVVTGTVVSAGNSLAVGSGQAAVPALLLAAPPASPTGNNGFSITGGGSPLAGWTENGSVATTASTATLSENATVTSGLSQTFVVPVGATSLEFTISSSDFRTNLAGNPPDAFEAALLDASGHPVIATASGLSLTDAFLNVQSSGDIFFAPGVSVSGRSASGQVAALNSPITVTADLTGVAAGTQVTLYFDLLGFGPYDSSLTLADAHFGLANGNHAPVAVDDRLAVNEDVATVLDVLANDSDAEHSPLTATLVDLPAHGVLTQAAGGAFLYTPAANYSGADIFTYRASDGLLDSRLATVSLSIAS
ncbi:MAG: cadherin-like domain-containing protein, partial [Candidatus Accumulibacter sp.]|uniref:Ig-like domain-containing protein n=1 Tax=Accumulibacter sp. TaxID=2053492 RepID=UPI0025CDF10A